MPAKSVAEKLLVKPGADVAVLFVRDAASAHHLLTASRHDLGTPRALSVVYPKANKSDINRDSLWPIAADYGLRPISQVAVDDVWSTLRFRPSKPGEEPFTGGKGD